MFRTLLQIRLVALALAALCVTAASGQTPAKKPAAARKPAAAIQSPAKKPAAAGKTIPAVESPAAGYRGARFQSNNRRDPFLNPLLLKKTESPDEEAPRGAPPPGMAGMLISQVELLGMSVGPEGQTAVFRGNDKRVYFLHKGDRLFDGFVKSVALDSVQLVRETKLRSGKVLTEEITKRLRTP
jgi:hypothetical protein